MSLKMGWAFVVVVVVSAFPVSRCEDQNTTDAVVGYVSVPLEKCPFNDSFPCLPKCCDMGQSMEPGGRKCSNNTFDFTPKFSDGRRPPNCDTCNLIVGDPCPYNGKYKLERDEEYELHPNGTLSTGGVIFSPDDFCMDSNHSEVYPLICFLGAPESHIEHFIRYTVYPIGMLVSVPFLVSTAGVYLYYEKLRDLHGKSLATHSLCLAMAYLVLAITQLGDSYSYNVCAGLAYTIQFFFLAAFTWLTVLAMDTCWNVLHATSIRNNKYQYPSKREEQRRVFLGYSVIAWCFPVICLITTIVMDIHPGIPASFLRPNVGGNSCWFGSKDASLSYFYGPIGVLFAVNIVFFGISLYRVFKCGISRSATPRQRVRMCFFLFVTMGISWTMELISWALDGPFYAWALPDVINILQGVIIFVIFVLEPEIRKQILQPSSTQAERERMMYHH